ncbi:MAG: lysophospholipid acyltransferase family protein [Candidatus Muiribacteriota bacterium]
MKNIDWLISKFFLNILFRIFFVDIKVINRQKIPQQGPLLIVSNHLSNLDPPIIMYAFNRHVVFMAKKEIFKVPLLSWILKKLKCFPVKRGKADKNALNTAKNRLSLEKLAVVMFPEGTRSTNHQIKKFKSGISYVWYDAGCPPVLPVALKGSENILKKGELIPNVSEVKVIIGDVLNIEEDFWDNNNRKESAEKFAFMLEKNVIELKNI